MLSKSIISKTFKKMKSINPEKGVSFAESSKKISTLNTIKARGVVTSKQLTTISKLSIGEEEEEKETNNENQFNNNKAKTINRRIRNNSSKTINIKTEEVLFNKISLANNSDYFYSESIEFFDSNEKVYIGLSYTSNPAISIDNFTYYNNDDTSTSLLKEQKVCKAIAIDNFEGNSTEGLFCFFEGHAGSEIANYLQKNFRYSFHKAKQLTTDIDNAIKIAFYNIDKEMEEKNLASGSTGNIIYIRKENNKQVFYSANVGNTKTYLITFDQAKDISYEHIVTNVQENKRLIFNGAMIINNKLMGNLNLSRSFGDYELKTFGVKCEPYITRHAIEDKDMYIVIESSSMWPLLNKIDLHKLSLWNQTSSFIMKNIINFPTIYNSTENIACFVLKLK